MCEAKSTGYPSIDKPWLKYYSTEAIHTKPAECTVYQNIYQHNQAHPHDLALEYFGVKITFSKLFAQVESCARALLHAGVHLGDRVTLCTSGTPEAVYVVLACSKIGAVANFINPMFQPEQIRDRINETEASLLCWTNCIRTSLPFFLRPASNKLSFSPQPILCLLPCAFSPA